MAVLFRIAFRNLKEHKAKTLIIGIIIALGITIMILGNSLMETAARGLRKSFIENYTGHLMISAETRDPVSLFGFQSRAGNEVIPRIPDYQRILAFLSTLPEVVLYSAQVSSFALIDLEEKGNSFTILFGIEPESYRRMFPDSIVLKEGYYLEAGQEGLLISQRQIDDLEEEHGVTFAVGDSLLLSGFGPAGFRVREIPIRGIFSLRQEMRGLDQINFIDVQSLRALQGMIVATDADIDLSEEETAYLETDNPDDLFAGDMLEEAESGEALSEATLLTLLGDRADDYRAPLDSGAWHFLLVRLKSDTQVKAVAAQLNRFFLEEGIEAAVVDWRQASGGFGVLADTLRTVFNVAILLVAVVAIIIIMNTLVISVIERTSEIGTMRALGAQKGMIRRMFILETFSIAFIFGLIGILLGGAIILVLNLTGIPASNTFFEMLFGGKTLHPVLSVYSVIYAVVIVLLIGFISSLYPVGVALKIQPVKAIQAE